MNQNWFVMAALLDESRFFVLDDTDYQTAVDHMVQSLTETRQVDAGFAERLRIRETKGTMLLHHAVAIPHGIQYAGDKLVLSIGVFHEPVSYAGNDVRLIFLIGLPSHVEDDNLLIRVYDEIIRITRDSELLDKIASADSFSALLRVLYRHIGE